MPTASDDVFITNNVTVTADVTADCGGLTLGAPGFPTLTGIGTVTLHGTSYWTAGRMTGSGRTVISPGATLAVNNASTINLNNRTLDIAGTLSWTGYIIQTSSAVITNRPGALVEIQNAGALGGSTRFDNAGTFRQIVGGVLTVSIPFNNYGTIEIQAGRVSLTGGGTHSGSFSIAAGALLSMSGTQNAGATSSFTGAGTLSVGGNATLAGYVNVTGTNTFGNIVNLTGKFFCTNNTLVISGVGGSVGLNGTGLVQPAVLSLQGGALGGSNVVTVLQHMDWLAGNLSARTIIPTGVTATVNSFNGVALTGGTLENRGTVSWLAGEISFNNGVITNRPGAIFLAQNTSSMSLLSGTNRFDNAGTFRKTVPNFTSVANGIFFNNYGLVEIQEGTLTLAGGGTHVGAFNVSTNATINFLGSHNANVGSSITGDGNLAVLGGTATLAGLINLKGDHTFSGGTAILTGQFFCTNNTVTISGGVAYFNGTGTVAPKTLYLNNGIQGGVGNLAGSNVVTVLDQMLWQSGTMSGGGRTVVLSGATLTINSDVVTLNTRTLENGGTVLWTTGSTFYLGNAIITNRPGALFDFSYGGQFSVLSGVSRFDNAGTVRKMDGGSIPVQNGISFNNSGVIELRPAILSLANGGYTQAANGLLNCSIGGYTAGTGYGRVQVSGAVTLSGALRVDFTNGFLPVVNDTFTVVTAGTLTGTFTSFSYPSNQATMQLSNTPNSVIARVTAVVPQQPVLRTPELSGSNLKLTWSAVSNIAYRVEYNPDLNPSNWSALPGDVTSLSNSASKSDVLTTSNRLYRVRLLP